MRNLGDPQTLFDAVALVYVVSTMVVEHPVVFNLLEQVFRLIKKRPDNADY